MKKRKPIVRVGEVVWIQSPYVEETRPLIAIVSVIETLRGERVFGYCWRKEQLAWARTRRVHSGPKLRLADRGVTWAKMGAAESAAFRVMLALRGEE